MQQNVVDLALLESLRETGDYERIAAQMPGGWQSLGEFDDEAIRVRLLAAEISGRGGRVDEMEAALAPYLENLNRVPLGLAARVMLMTATYRFRRHEPSEALKLAQAAKVIASARDDEFTVGEALQLEGQALWSLERWAEAVESFKEAIALYAAQMRSYRMGLAYLCLGAVLHRTGRAEEARTILERGIRILLKSHDDYNLAVARVNVALALNVLGEYETALRYLEYARDTFEQIRHEQYTYLVMNNIASTLAAMKELDRAESCADLALQKGALARSTQIASTYEIKARIHMARREFEEAARMLATAWEIAEQANSQSQKVEIRRTYGRLYLALERDDEAAAMLWDALDIAQKLQASLLEVEIKALLAQSLCLTDPVEACNLLSEVESALSNRPLPELKREMQAARRRINALDQERFFILSDAQIPLLADAKIALLKWLWARALYKARGNARDAASILGVTPTYIRKLTKVIPRDLLRPGKKRTKKN
ncbi:MAG TPA: tetratricopeptide repeat protein [Blastocatellia bacterium]|nr:tetratricopeptide repeat protein [Blastocatellia bacterium]